MANIQDLKTEIFDYVRFRLGDQMVDVELDVEHYEQALNQAIIIYRQRSANSVEESYSFLELIQDKNTYQLPDEVISVRNCFKRNIGANSGTSSQYEPFEAGFVNFYMIQSGRVGGLSTYFMYSAFLKEAAKMFGGYLNYKYNRTTKEITIMRRPRADAETILLWTENYKPDFTLLTDIYSKPWLRDYTLGMCMLILGEARSKFSTLPGPQGGSTLNGTDLISRGQAVIDKCMEDLKNYVDGQTPMWFVIG
jgi:hypothetical protein